MRTRTLPPTPRRLALLALPLAAALVLLPRRTKAAPPAPAPAAPPAALPVAVQGTLQQGEFFGAPGFGENPGSDHTEPVYYLQLPAPLHEQIRPASTLAEFSQPAQNGYFIQLLVFDEEQSVARTLVGKKVRIVGALVEPETAHRKSPAQIQVKSLSPIRDWQW